MLNNAKVKTTPKSVEWYKSKNHNNICSIIQNWLPQQFIFNNAKVKIATINLQ